jgi:hypothetical protein
VIIEGGVPKAAQQRLPREKHLWQAGDIGSAGRMIAFTLRGEEIEISCAKVADLRDNGFNIGGLAIWDGIGRMDRQDQFEADPAQQLEDRDISLFRGIQIGLIRIAHKA